MSVDILTELAVLQYVAQKGVFTGERINKLKYGNILGCLFVLFLALIFTITVAYSAFNDIGIGTRPMGMGGAFVALANDSNSLLWNPAGISFVDRIEANVMFEEKFRGIETVGIDNGFLGFVYPIPFIPRIAQLGSIGVGVHYLSVDQKYIESIIGVTYSFSLTGFGYTIPVLYRIPLRFGLTVKRLYSKYIRLDVSRGYIDQDPVFNYGKSEQTDFTGDIGIHFTLNKRMVENLGDNEILFGVSAENILPASDISTSQSVKDDINKKWKESGNVDEIFYSRRLRLFDRVPINIRVGFAHKLLALSFMTDFTNSIEVTYRSDFQKKWDDKTKKYKTYDFINDAENITFRYGFETWFLQKMIGFRLGALMGKDYSGTEIKYPVYVNATAGWTYILYGPKVEGKAESFSDVRIDYAVIAPVYGSLQFDSKYRTHKVSVIAKFGESVHSVLHSVKVTHPFPPRITIDGAIKLYNNGNYALARDFFKEAYDLTQNPEYKQKYEEVKAKVESLITPILKDARESLNLAKSIEEKTKDLSTAEETDAIDAGDKYAITLEIFKSAVKIDAKNVEASDGVKICENKIIAMGKKVEEIKDYKERDKKVQILIAEANNYTMEKNWVKAYEKLNEASKLIPAHEEVRNEMKIVKPEFDKYINDAMVKGIRLFKEGQAERIAKGKEEKLRMAEAEFRKVIEVDNAKKKEAEDWIKKIKDELVRIK